MPKALFDYRSFINGTELYYEANNQSPSKQTIILLHGFLSSSFSFRKLAPLLAEDFNIISIDLPPFGKSGKSKKYRYSYRNMAETVLKLLDQLECTNIYVLGHSMGGQIALNMMHQRPDFIKKGILLNSSGYLPRAKSALIFSSYIPLFSRFVKYHLDKTGVIGNLRLVVHNKSLIDEEMVIGYTEPFHDRFIFEALRRMIRDREGDLPPQVLRTINTPCLLLWGEYDRVVPLGIGKRLADDLPNSELIVLKETGHLTPEENPKEVFEQIRNYVLG
jgi:pimeloyl-ACP methyl ester carboxylesterase